MGLFAELRRRHVFRVAIVYVTVGFAVLQGAALLLPTMSVPDWAFRLIVAGVLLGFPIALVLAWARDVASEGPAREDPAPAPGAQAAPAAPAAPFREVSERSVAVLPFANLSDSSDNEYFSDGITEEILTVLSKVRSLEVISRTSVMRYKATVKGIVEIADELRVAHVVEGSVRRHGDRVRITAQLIDARTDRHLWAETYDRDLDDVFAIQSDVAERIVESLRGALTPAERARIETRPTENMESYQWFLKGRQLLAQRGRASLRRAVEALDRAIAADPGFALAWAHRAQGLALLAVYDPASTTKALDQARESARRALEIQPDLADAHAALGLAARFEKDWDGSDRHLRRALELEPASISALHWYALLLVTRGRFDEAIATLGRALELDPLSVPLHMVTGAALFHAGQLDEAERIYRRGLEFDPGSAALHGNLASLYEQTGRYEEAIRAMEAVARLDAQPTAMVEEIRRGFEERGERGYWEAQLEAYRSRPDQRGRLYNMALALSHLGRPDEAIEFLEQMYEGPFFTNFHTDPKLAPLRAHPRFVALAERLGLGEALREAEVSRGEVSRAATRPA